MRLPVAALAAVALSALAAGVGAQEPKPKDKDAAKKPADAPKADAKADPKADVGKDSKPLAFEEPAFKSADGVKLNGKFYPGRPGAPVVLLLNSVTDVTPPSAWLELIRRLTAFEVDPETKLQKGGGYNVLSFDYRGFGKNNEVIPAEFWANSVNQQLIAGGGNRAAQGTIDRKRFAKGYVPMFAQDIAAARSAIDQMNDNGTVNASTIYVIGTGDAAGLGLFYLATEWLREGRKPNVAIPPQYVSPRRNLFPNAEPAGRDYGGAVWLSPAIHPSLKVPFLKEAVLSPAAIEMRTETPMLFLYGAKDKKSLPVAKSLAGEVLAAGSGAGTGAKLQKAVQIFVRPVPDTDATGTNLLDASLGTFTQIEEFLAQMDKDRKSRLRKPRDWDKPLIIDIRDYGLGR